MKKSLLFVCCAILLIALSGCSKPAKPALTPAPSQTDLTPTPSAASANPTPQDTALSPLPQQIPTNSSVNIAWGGNMCEANGFIYSVSKMGSNEVISRMKPDGSGLTQATAGEYPLLRELTSDGSTLYFIAETTVGDTIYKLPLGGGAEQKVTDGTVYGLQTAGGKLYWIDYQLAIYQLNCVNTDGSGLQTLLTVKNPSGVEEFDFLAVGDSIYYVTGEPGEGSDFRCDIFRMSLDGKNTVKLNSAQFGLVNKLFFDQGKLYFLMENTEDASELNESLLTLDEKGGAVPVLAQVGYFPQDYQINAYCGISGGYFYHFVLTKPDGSGDHEFMDLCQYDLAAKKDTVVLRDVDMGNSSVDILSSPRGKVIHNSSAPGLYILGNDIYFSPSVLY